MQTPEFTIQILEHDGTVEAEIINPTALTYTFQHGALGPSSCSWSMAETDDVVLALDGVDTMPKKRDWRLMADGFPVMAGILMSVNMPLSGNEIHCVGHDWLAWYDQPWRAYYDDDDQANMNYSDDIDTVISADAAEQFHKIMGPGSTVQDWLEEIISPVEWMAGILPEQIGSNWLFSGTAMDEELVGHLARSSGRTVLSLFQELAAMGAPYGFDFWFDWNKDFNFVGPRKTDELAIFPIATMTESSGSFLGDDFDESPIIDGEWTNDGPVGTDILFEDGLGNATRYFRKVHQDSIDVFRRWGHDVTIGSRDPFTVGTQTEQEFKAAAAAYRLIFPQRELSLKVKPELFTFYNVLLDPIDVDYRKFPGSFRRIDANFWVTKQAYSEDEAGSGNWVCDLSLDQIYAPI